MRFLKKYQVDGERKVSHNIHLLEDIHFQRIGSMENMFVYKI